MKAKEDRVSYILFRYFKEHLRFIVFTLLFLGIFAYILSLYNLPAAAVGYAGLLCACMAFLTAIYDINAYFKHHRALRDMRSRIMVSLEGLPKPCSLHQQDYESLLMQLSEENRNLISGHDVRNREMSDYYTLWVHQIKTPIAAARILLQSEEEPVGKAVSMELFHIERYVEMVLQYLRMEDMSGDLQISSYPLMDLVKKAVKKYAPIFIHKKITVEFGNITYEAMTDEKWLTFALEQLLSNALKYTNTGGTISIYMDEEKANTLVIRDNGIGISREDLPRIFERGFTGYNGRMGQKSTGLGLYLCRRIMERLNHDLRIWSEAGEGTKVNITFPVKEGRLQ